MKSRNNSGGRVNRYRNDSKGKLRTYTDYVLVVIMEMLPISHNNVWIR